MAHRRSHKQGRRPFAFELSIDDRTRFDQVVSEQLWGPRPRDDIQCLIGQRVLSRFGEAELTRLTGTEGCVLTFRVGEEAFAEQQYARTMVHTLLCSPPSLVKPTNTYQNILML